ncbi:MAG TPA: nucleotidyl transferase AbiEii/AbiGii toxin family protein [Streptosporangiaceae bacterium]|nr:nucleotidyl transferase AbiEii/AbiGii toxin family protein [Streptosporangiaceae bacterium]
MPDDQVRASDYDDPMSSRLLGIAADVLRSFGSAFGGRHLAIVGGAVPGLLVPMVPPGIAPHVGTADLDLHLSLHLLDGETADYYRAIIDGLRSLTLRPDTQDGREIKWRWVGRYRGAQVRVELLCPVRTRAGRPEKPAVATTAEANIGPSGEITALAVGFGHLVPEDTITVRRRVETHRKMLTYEFPVAGIASWLCLKADAIMRRDKPKDAYDVVWLTDALGPEQAAEAIAASPLLAGQSAAEVITQLGRLVHDQFRDIAAAGPVMYADFLEAQPRDIELRHAHGSIAALGQALRKRGIDLA